MSKEVLATKLINKGKCTVIGELLKIKQNQHKSTIT